MRAENRRAGTFALLVAGAVLAVRGRRGARARGVPRAVG